jgi:hypothetical protein
MLNIGDTWTCATGTSNGLPQLIRCRTNLDKIVGGKTHRRLLRITWKYTKTDQSGLPSAELNERMATFENAIVGELERDSLAIFVSIWVCNGVKEWSAYISDAQRTCNRLNQALESHDPFPVELTVEDDPSWQEYKSLLGKLKPE